MAELATRITTGSEEVRNILKSGRMASLEPAYKGYTFFTDAPTVGPSNVKYLPTPSYGDKFGGKLGYVIRAERGALQDVPKAISMGAPYSEYYRDMGYKVAPPATPSSAIQTIQKVKVAPQLNEFKEKYSILGPERSFEKFQQKYEGISAAAKPRFAVEMGRDLRPATRTLANALSGFGRAAGRAAGPVGVAMTAYDLAQAFPAPTPISEEDMGQALREYRTGPQPRY